MGVFIHPDGEEAGTPFYFCIWRQISGMFLSLLLRSLFCTSTHNFSNISQIKCGMCCCCDPL